MFKEQWDVIFKKIKQNEINFGSLTLKLFYHEKRFVKYEITKTEAIIIREEDNKEKESF